MTSTPTSPVNAPKGYRNTYETMIYWIVPRKTRRGVHYFEPESGWLDEAQAERGARMVRESSHKPVRVVAILPGAGFPKRLG